MIYSLLARLLNFKDWQHFAGTRISCQIEMSYWLETTRQYFSTFQGELLYLHYFCLIVMMKHASGALKQRNQGIRLLL